MKLKQIISLAIALLLICGLPLSAFAMNDNPEGGTVSVPAGETMGTNSGTVNTNNGDVGTNYGTIETNNGDVGTNYGIVDYNSGTVGTNNNIVNTNVGEVTTNAQNGIVTYNGTATDNANAKVGTNNGDVHTNYGIIEINNGDVSINNGDVSINDAGVGTNNDTVVINNGTVYINYGTVKTNGITGDVTNFDTGNVETNNGTVTYRKGNEEITFYGVQVDGSLLQKEVGVELNLKEKFSKEGYVLAGYIMNWRMDDDRGLVSMETPKTTDDYIYSLDHPNVLTLIWMAISGSGGGSGDLDEDKGNGSAAAWEKPEYFGPGCYISLNGKQYILTEIKGEDYYLASCEEYTQEELAEAGELLESLLTEEQLSHVTGEAGILEGELNELFFGGGSRIVFPCDIGMIFY